MITQKLRKYDVLLERSTAGAGFQNQQRYIKLSNYLKIKT